MASSPILGLHHITAISGPAGKNVQFYRDLLGYRLVKKTVNFDDPGTYHLYYADYFGNPGTVLTFFPYERAARGVRGSGMTTAIGLEVPTGSLKWWKRRLEEESVIHNNISKKFGRNYIPLIDHDGLKIELTETDNPSNQIENSLPGIDLEFAPGAFHHATLTLQDIQATREVLTDLLGYKLFEQEVNQYRLVHPDANRAKYIDLVEARGEQRGRVAAGIVHHIAFRVADDAAQMKLRERLIDAGLEVTEQIDRNYFRSLYFREPGGVLFEIATDIPGFDVDEPLDELGTALKLPTQYEAMRPRLETILPKI